MRSDVSLSTIIRVVERILKKKQEADKDSVEDLLWSYKNAFMNKTSDFMMDSSSGSPLSVIAKEEIIIEGDFFFNFFDFIGFIVDTDYGHLESFFFKKLELLGLDRHFGLGHFGDELSGPILVGCPFGTVSSLTLVHVFHYSTISSTKN